MSLLFVVCICVCRLLRATCLAARETPLRPRYIIWKAFRYQASGNKLSSSAAAAVVAGWLAAGWMGSFVDDLCACVNSYVLCARAASPKGN